MSVERRECLKTAAMAAGATFIPAAMALPTAQGSSLGLRRFRQVEPYPRYGHATALVANRFVLVIGGIGPDGNLASCQLYDPDRNVWYDAAPLARPRGRHTASEMPGGEILVLGGFDGGALSLASIYDPRSDKWRRGAPLKMPRYGHTTQALPDGRFVLTGGFSNGPLAEAEVYTPS